MMTKKSDKIWQKALNLIPTGTQTFSKLPKQFAEGITPKLIDKGLGSRVWDLDGNRYLDHLVGLGPILLGYCDPDVNEAVLDQLGKGSIFGLPTKLETDVAELLVKHIPCAESVRFGKNGADVTTAAVRLSRSITGKDGIVYCGYHGWHDWYICNTNLNSGIPAFNNDLSYTFNYNELDMLEDLLKRKSSKIACVIMEPVSVYSPKEGFLAGVRELTKKYGVILIFDEIWSGFRWSIGGAQEYFNIIPDIACFAKAMSNGFPVSAIVGKKKYMDRLSETFFSFTYGGECLSLAAAKATINKIIEKNVIPKIWNSGEYLQTRLNDLINKYKFDEFIKCIGYPVRSILSFKGSSEFSSLELKTFFQQEFGKDNIIWCGYNGISFSHSEECLNETINSFEKSLQKLGPVIFDGFQIKKLIQVPVIQPIFKNVSDFMSVMNR